MLELVTFFPDFIRYAAVTTTITAAAASTGTAAEHAAIAAHVALHRGQWRY